MTPKTPVEALFRAEALRLAHDQPFARRLLNSGRLSVPCSLEGFPLQTPGDLSGRAVLDAPLQGPEGDAWLIEQVQGRFTLVGFGEIDLPEIDGIARIGISQTGKDYPCFSDPTGLALQRYGAGRACLFRPDGHVCASFERPDAASISQARNRALGLAP